MRGVHCVGVALRCSYALALVASVALCSVAFGQCPPWRHLPPYPSSPGGVLGGPDPAVHALTTFNGDLIVGGDFWQAGPNSAARYIARFDAVNAPHWLHLGSPFAGSPTFPNPRVVAMTEYGGELIAGGNFVTANGAVTTVNHIARWNGTSWQPVGTGPTVGMNNTVRALAVFGGQLIAGGDFITAGGQSASFVARWNGSSWQAMPAVAAFNSSVTCFTIHDGELIAGGFFTAPGARVARWNGTIWQSLPAGGFNNTVHALAVFNGELYAGGAFTFVDGIQTGRHIARLTTTTGWDPLAGGGTNDDVLALAAYDGKLIVGGSFTTAGPYTALGIAAWDPTFSWRAISYMGDGEGGVGDVLCLTPFHDTWFAGGKFVGIDGVGFFRIAAFGAARWLNPTSGSFHDAANWTLGWIPVFECATFGGDLSSTSYTVTFSSPASNQTCVVTNHNVIFDLGGFQYSTGETILGQTILDPWSGAASYGPQVASLTVTNGTLAGQIDVGSLSTLAGDGTILGNVDNSGTLRPGNLAAGGGGTLTIDGECENFGVLSFDLDGATTPGVDYNTLVVTGTATLGGTVSANISPGYSPQNGDTFDVLTAGSLAPASNVLFATGLPAGVLLTLDSGGARQGGGGGERGPGQTITLNVLDYTGSLDLEAPADSTLSDSAADAVLADFNGDAFLDIAVALPSIDGVVVLLNDGGSAQTFTQQPLISVGDEPVSIVAAALDANAGVDLAVVNRSSESVSILSNNGSGAFSVSQTVSVGPHRPVAIATGTLDGGASIDLAVAVQLDASPALDGAVVLENNGAGSFAAQPIIKVAGGPVDIVAADLDDNGAVDLALLMGATNEVAVLFNDGLPFARGFGSPQVFGVGLDPRFVNPEDLDNDKDIDLVVGGGSNSMTLLLNDGSGSLGGATVPLSGPALNSTAADLDNDGDAELLIALDDQSLSQRVVRVYRNDTIDDQLALAQAQDLVAGQETTIVLSGDVDNDGEADVVTITDSIGQRAAAGRGGSHDGARGPAGNTVSMLKNEVEPNPCPEDIAPPGGDGSITIADVTAVITAFGLPCNDCPQDIVPQPDGDDQVTIADVTAVLTAFGPCGP